MTPKKKYTRPDKSSDIIKLIRLSSNLNEYGSQVEKILKLAKEGVTKEDIMLRLSLSRPRLIAQLVNKDLLRYHVTLNSFMTTARGHLYLKRIRVEIKAICNSVKGTRDL